MGNEFANRAVQLAAADIETNLINSERDYQDAVRVGDELLAAEALKNYSTYKFQHDSLTGANQPKQQSGELSIAQRNFISRRAALGDDVQTNSQRAKDYHLAHVRAVNAGLQVDSPQYFAAVERSVDSMGDGRQPVLNEREAARLCGIDDQTYANNAAKLRAMKARGEYT